VYDIYDQALCKGLGLGDLSLVGHVNGKAVVEVAVAYVPH
jgi:hypothetical protein